MQWSTFANDGSPSDASSMTADPRQHAITAGRPLIPTGHNRTVPGQHGQMVTEAFEQNRSWIPGLGLGFAGSETHAREPLNAVEVRSFTNKQAVGQRTEERLIPESSSHNTFTTRSKNSLPEPEDLSEGELEDLYEPGDAVHKELGVPMPPSPRPPLPNLPEVVKPGNTGNAPPTLPDTTLRQTKVRRPSGSYSPHLSPKEIRRKQSSALHKSNHGSRSMPLAMPASDLAQTEHATSIPVAQAKRDAREAIQKLWPFNIRFQNFVDEGIDKSILEELFQELGLDVNIPATRNSPLSTRNVNTKPHKLHKKADLPAASAEINRAQDVEDQGADTQSPQNPEETRKDRIARLLALKHAKSTVSVAKPAQVEDSTAKVKSEKSKLLQQKMEALRRSRESRALKHVSKVATVDIQPNTDLSTGPVPERVSPPSQVHQPVIDISTHSPATGKEGEASLSPIPGLSLSSPKLLVKPSLPKRPIATDFDDFSDYSGTGANKRPFGRTRDSKPFLIDVSDDEDDAEMELESLGRQSVGRSPSPTTLSFQEDFLRPQTLFPRSLSSPGVTPSPAATTPKGPGGRVDLESMNKKIEAMKRMIAEAEARKGAKQPQSQPLHLKEKPDVLSTPSVSSTPIADANSQEETSVEPTHLSSQLPSPDSARGSDTNLIKRKAMRSRATSEQHSLLEATRRDRVSRLLTLRSQIEAIEAEMQNDINEEERLRNEEMTDDPPSGSEVDRFASEITGDLSTSQNDLGYPATRLIASLRNEKSTSPIIGAVSESLITSNNIELQNGKDKESTNNSQDTEKTEADGLLAVNDVHPAGIQRGDSETYADNGRNTSSSSLPEDTKDEDAASHGVNEDLHVSQTAPSRSESMSDSHAKVEAEIDVPLDVEMQDADVRSSSGSESSEENENSLDTSQPALNSSIPSQVDSLSATISVLPSTADHDLNPALLENISSMAQISAGNQESSPEADREQHEVHDAHAILSTTPSSTFQPYETPLQYFRAFRFHPQYSQTVAGGLRSLTYSNKLNVKTALCPDQLTNGQCSKRPECEFQHFEDIRAPDDQVLLQLGAYGNYDESQKQRYIAGLRQLLTGFRDRKVKDFKTISEAIVAYRAQFIGDKSKILPLGGVTI